MKSITCMHCKSTFIPTTHSRRYCGEDCRKAAKAARDKGRERGGKLKPARVPWDHISLNNVQITIEGVSVQIVDDSSDWAPLPDGPPPQGAASIFDSFPPTLVLYEEGGEFVWKEQTTPRMYLKLMRISLPDMVEGIHQYRKQFGRSPKSMLLNHKNGYYGAALGQGYATFGTVHTAPKDKALGYAFGIAAALLDMEDQEFFQEIAEGTEIDLAELLEAREVIRSVCYTDEPDLVRIERNTSHGDVPANQYAQQLRKLVADLKELSVDPQWEGDAWGDAFHQTYELAKQALDTADGVES